MKRLWIVLSALAVLGLVSSAGAADEQKKKRDPEKMLKKIDSDADGKVSAEEFKKFAEQSKGKLKDQPELAEKRFKKSDADGDGKLSLDEFKKMIEGKKKKTDKP